MALAFLTFMLAPMNQEQNCLEGDFMELNSVQGSYCAASSFFVHVWNLAHMHNSTKNGPPCKYSR